MERRHLNNIHPEGGSEDIEEPTRYAPCSAATDDTRRERKTKEEEKRPYFMLLIIVSY